MFYRRALCNDYSHSSGGSDTVARSQVQAATGRGTKKKTRHWCGGPTGTRGMENTELKSWRTHMTYSFVRIITEISRAINNSLSFRRLPSICIWVCMYVRLCVCLCIHAYPLSSLSLYINFKIFTRNYRFSEFLKHCILYLLISRIPYILTHSNKVTIITMFFSND